MKINKNEIWLAKLNPGYGTELGKTRPVVIIQSDFINDSLPSVIVCPITSQILLESKILRVHLNEGQINKACDILIDQIRAIDKRRLIKKVGQLNIKQINQVNENVKIVLDLI